MTPNQLSLTRALAFASLGLGLGLAGCRDAFDKIEDYQATNPAVVAEDLAEVRAPEGFGFQSARAVEVDLRALEPTTDRPVAGVGLSVATLDGSGVEVELGRGATDADGRWSAGLVVPADRDSVDLLVHHAGFPQRHRLAVGSGERALAYTLGAARNDLGRVVPESELADLPDPGFEYDDNDQPVSTRENVGGRAPMSFLGGYDHQGVPDYLTTPGTIWPDVLDFIALNLPETPGVPEGNPHYLDNNNQGSVLLREAGELWISFAHEGAGYRNTLGYFTYDLNAPPGHKDDIDVHTVVFPNVSYENSGGGLAVADRVYLGSFPAGTGVGWFLIPNGWDASSQTVGDKWNTRYSIDDLNRFTRKKSRKHCVLLANEVREFLVLGFEDLNRPAGDNDFNDATFVIEPRPWSSVITDHTPAVELPGDDGDGDGVADNVDLYPDDPARAFEVYTPARGTFGTLAYEDMWPRTSDYDFNDLVVDYSFVEVLNSANQIKDIRARLRVRALGSSQDHGFALHLPRVDPALVEAVAGQVLGDNDYVQLASNGTEAGLSTAVVPAFTSGFGLFATNRGIINTDEAKDYLSPGEQVITITLREPQYREAVGVPPYDPFLLRSRDRGREIHLAGHAPTPAADVSSFNTFDDASDVAAGRFYVDENNLPWALDLPASMTYPREQVRIDAVYPDFAAWATYGGDGYEGWFRDGSGEGGYSGGQ